MFAWLALVSTAFAAPCCAVDAGSHRHMSMPDHAAHGDDTACHCLHATPAADVAVPGSLLTWQNPAAPTFAVYITMVDLAWQPLLRPPAG